MISAIELKQLERSRREALWKLHDLRPGDIAALPWLNVLDELEDHDQDVPTINSLADTVPVTNLGELRMVRDGDIPEPWRTRFEMASIGSTRLSEGAYEHDWKKFLRLWVLESASC